MINEDRRVAAQQCAGADVACVGAGRGVGGLRGGACASLRSARRHVPVGALRLRSAPARPLLIWTSAACPGNAAQRQPLDCVDE